jgi:hypothetical protein
MRMRNKPSEIDVGIQVGFNENFEDTWWRIQRSGRVVMMLFVLAGIGGVFGRGLYSKTTTSQVGALLQVRYEWAARYQTPSIIEIIVNKKAIRNGMIRLRINGDILDKLHVQQISPQPWLTELLPADNVLIFKTNPTQDSAKIRLAIQPSRIGKLHASIGLDGLPAVEFDQFIWP